MDKSAVQRFGELLDCSICLGRFVQPKVLPCQHTFCLSCLTGAADYSDHGIIKCPECRALHRIPNSGIEGFPNNVTLQRFLGVDSIRNYDDPPSYDEVVYGIQAPTVATVWKTAPRVTIQPSAPIQTNQPSASIQTNQSKAPIDSNQSLQWVTTSRNRIPPSACIGGSDGTENLYIGRATHKGSLTPGKVHPSHKTCYIAWGGREHAKNEYEILLGKGSWVYTSGSCIPPGAVLGGHTENHENLYIGRVRHLDTVTIGKVQSSHGVCYISYNGKEIAFKNYEIFVE